VTLQDHYGAAFQVAHRIAPFMQIKFLSSGQHTYSNHSDKVAVIMVKLFEQTLLADVEMHYIKETVFGVQDGAPLMDCTHPCLVALAAA
jgi:hypothetical protein